MSEKDVIERADDLINSLEDNKPDKKQKKSLELKEQEETKKKKKLNATDAEEVLQSREQENSQVFKIKRLGYHRLTHYRSPKWWSFLALSIIILVLIALIGIQLPYIPPHSGIKVL